MSRSRGPNISRSRAPRAVLETSGTVFPIRAALGRQIKVYIFFHGIAVKVPKMSEILVKIIKLTFAIIALVIGIHNCLTLPKIHINA